MKELTDEEFERIRKDYKDDNIKIGVQLNLARKFLIETQDTATIIWGCSFTLAMIAIFFVSIYSLGFPGVLFAILFCVLFTIYLGICTINTSIRDIIFFVCILCAISSISLEWKYCILSLFTFGNGISAYLFYKYVGWKTVHDIAFKDKSALLYLLQQAILIIS